MCVKNHHFFFLREARICICYLSIFAKGDVSRNRYIRFHSVQTRIPASISKAPVKIKMELLAKQKGRDREIWIWRWTSCRARSVPITISRMKSVHFWEIDSSMCLSPFINKIEQYNDDACRLPTYHTPCTIVPSQRMQ